MSFSDSWDPMEEDYRSKSFNSYSSMDKVTHRRNDRELDFCSIYIKRYPLDLDHNSFLSNVRKYGTICKFRFLEFPDNTSVLIRFSSEDEAQRAMNAFNKKPPFFMDVQFANKQRDNNHSTSNHSPMDSNYQMQNSSARVQNILRGSGRGQLLNNYDEAELKDIKVVCGKQKRDVISTAAIERYSESSTPNHRTQEVLSPSVGRGATLKSLIKSPTHPLTGNQIHVTNKYTSPSPRDVNSYSKDMNGASSSSSSYAPKPPALIDISFCCQRCSKSSLFCCGNCKTPYCSVECQQRDWPIHERICGAGEKSLSSDSNMSEESHTSDCQGSGDSNSRKMTENNSRFRNGPRKKIELNEEVCSRESEKPVADTHKNFNKTSPQSSNTSLIPNPLQSMRRIKTNVIHKPNLHSVHKASEVKSNEVQNHDHSPEVPKKILSFHHLKKVKIPETGEKVVVCKIDSPFKFWVMRSSDKETLSNIEKQISLCRNKIQLSCPNMYDLVLAVNKNKKLCRGVIKQVNSKKMASNVQFVDYGGEEEINHTDLYLMSEQLASYSPVAILCKLSESEIQNRDWGTDEVSNFKLLILGKEFKSHDIKYEGDVCELSLVNDDGVSVSSVLASQKNSLLLSCLEPCKDQNVSCTPQTKNVPLKIPTIYEELKVSMKLNIGAALTVKNKICVYAINSLEVETFRKELIFITNNLLDVQTEDISGIANEMDIAVGYSIEYKSWYRCIVMKCIKNKFLVRYIDFGNEEEITKLHKLPQNLSCKCSILICEGDEDFSTECHDAFLKGDLLDAVVSKVGSDCAEVIVTGAKGKHIVKCYSVYHDLKLSVAQQAEPLPSSQTLHSPIVQMKKVPMVSALRKRSLSSNGLVKIMLCHAESGVFYCHLYSDSATLNDLSQKLQKLPEAPVSQTPNIGELYCVKSSDGFWYRGSIEEICQSRNVFKICFTDYGNCEEVPLQSLKHLPVEFSEIPKLCIPVKIKNIESVQDLSVTPLSVKSTGSVENGIQVVNIVDATLADTEKPIALQTKELPSDKHTEIIVTHIENETYFCHIKSDVPEITKMAESLQTCKNLPLSTVPKLEGLFRVKCSDGFWYRGLVKSIVPDKNCFNILFLDYGNCEEVPLANIQQLPKEFDAYPVFCVPFKFSDPTTLKALENTVVRVGSSDGVSLIKLALPKTIYKFSSLKILSLPEKKYSEVKFQVTTDESMFVHSVSHQKDLEKLNDMLKNYKSNNITHTPVVDEVLCIKSEGGLHRGCIKQILPDNLYKVFFIDYGYIEDIHYNNLLDVSEELLSFSIFSIPVLIQNPTLHSKHLDKNHIYTVESIKKKSDNIHLVRIVNSLPLAVLEKSTLLLNEPHEVVFIYAEKDVYFLQLKSEFLKISDLANQLIQCSQKEKISHSPFIGELVCAKSSLDNMWYRGCIKEILPSNTFKVHFVDYGNCEVLDKQNLQSLNEELAKYPVFGIPVTVTNISDVLGGLQLERLYDVIAESVSKVSKVKIIVKEVLQAVSSSVEDATLLSVADTSEFMYGDCIQGEVPTGQQCVAISNVDPQIVFMVVDDNAIAELDTLTKLITSYCNHLQCSTYNGPSIVDGLMVLAKYDNEWFRAVVVETMPDDLYEVYFVDYGNGECLKKESLRRMEPQFMTSAINAHICDLNGYSYEDSSSLAVTRELESFKNMPLEASVEKISLENGSDSYLLTIPDITQRLVSRKLATVQM